MNGRFPGQRAIRIAVRTGHIASAGLTLGAATFGADAGSWPLLAAFSGALLVADDLFRYGENWLRYAQAWGVILKLAGLWLGIAFPAFLAPSLWVALVLGSTVSHAPGAIRQFALWGEPGPCAVRAGNGCARSTREEVRDDPVFPLGRAGG